MTAFVTPSALARSAFTPRHADASAASPRATCGAASVSMTAKFPGDESAPYSKFMSKIPLDRLNKAPVIVINPSSNPDYANVSVSLCDMSTNIPNAVTLLNGIDMDDTPAPSSAIWGKYYDPNTVHEAPHISIADIGSKSYVAIAQVDVPTNISAGKALLEPGEPEPAQFEAAYPDKARFEAPYISITGPDDESDGRVDMDMYPVGLDLYSAAAIKEKYAA